MKKGFFYAVLTFCLVACNSSMEDEYSSHQSQYNALVKYLIQNHQKLINDTSSDHLLIYNKYPTPNVSPELNQEQKAFLRSRNIERLEYTSDSTVTFIKETGSPLTKRTVEYLIYSSKDSLYLKDFHGFESCQHINENWYYRMDVYSLAE